MKKNHRAAFISSLFLVFLCQEAFAIPVQLSPKKTKLFFEQYIPKVLNPGDYLLLKEVYPIIDVDEYQIGTLVLEDSSVWKVKPSFVSDLENWKPGHRIVLTQNNTLFSSVYPLRLINYTRNSEAIEVAHYSGPDARYHHTHVIKSLNYTTGELDFYGSRTGRLRKADSKIFNLWKPHDKVIIGVNSSYGSDYSHIILNTSCEQQASSGAVVLCNFTY